VKSSRHCTELHKLRSFPKLPQLNTSSHPLSSFGIGKQGVCNSSIAVRAQRIPEGPVNIGEELSGQSSCMGVLSLKHAVDPSTQRGLKIRLPTSVRFCRGRSLSLQNRNRFSSASIQGKMRPKSSRLIRRRFESESCLLCIATMTLQGSILADGCLLRNLRSNRLRRTPSLQPRTN